MFPAEPWGWGHWNLHIRDRRAPGPAAVSGHSVRDCYTVPPPPLSGLSLVFAPRLLLRSPLRWEYGARDSQHDLHTVPEVTAACPVVLKRRPPRGKGNLAWQWNWYTHTYTCCLSRSRHSVLYIQRAPPTLQARVISRAFSRLFCWEACRSHWSNHSLQVRKTSQDLLDT